VGIELNHKPRQSAKKGDPAVAVRIEGAVYETPKAYGRHFTEENDIYSLISRDSIDILKTSFRGEMTDDYWKLVIRLKSLLGIQ
jgi:translation initiation factor 5B